MYVCALARTDPALLPATELRNNALKTVPEMFSAEPEMFRSVPEMSSPEAPVSAASAASTLFTPASKDAICSLTSAVTSVTVMDRPSRSTVWEGTQHNTRE